MTDHDTDPRTISKPAVFAVGAKLCVRYRSVQETRQDESKSAVGFVITEEDGVLVVEEYHNFARQNEHRHVLVDTDDKNVYSQTEKQTSRMGQVDELTLWAPPWPSTYDTLAGGLGSVVRIQSQAPNHYIEEGIYKYPDPAQLDAPDGWPGKYTVDDPLPEEMQSKNPETAYHPEVSIDAIQDIS